MLHRRLSSDNPGFHNGGLLATSSEHSSIRRDVLRPLTLRLYVVVVVNDDDDDDDDEMMMQCSTRCQLICMKVRTRPSQSVSQMPRAVT